MAQAIGIGAPAEQGARSALLVWGGGLLVAGLGLVGVGAGWEGAPLALAGMLNTIYGIHTYGRLGPDDEQADAGAGAARSAAMWTGGLTALAGLLVAADHYLGFSGNQPAGGAWAVSAYGLAVVGVARAARAARSGVAPARNQAPKAKRKRKVENRARMDKSRAP